MCTQTKDKPTCPERIKGGSHVKLVSLNKLVGHWIRYIKIKNGITKIFNLRRLRKKWGMTDGPSQENVFNEESRVGEAASPLSIIWRVHQIKWMSPQEFIHPQRLRLRDEQQQNRYYAAIFSHERRGWTQQLPQQLLFTGILTLCFFFFWPFAIPFYIFFYRTDFIDYLIHGWE